MVFTARTTFGAATAVRWRRRLGAVAATAAMVTGVVAGGSPTAGAMGATSVTHYLNAVSCPGRSVCVAVGGANAVDTQGTTEGAPSPLAYQSGDGGAGWSRTALPALGSGVDLSSVSCPTSAICAAVGAHDRYADHAETPTAAAAIYSTDGGDRWRVASAGKGALPMYSVSCASADRCVAVGGSYPHGSLRMTPEAWVSTDGGAHWSRAGLPRLEGVLQTVSCPSAKICVATGADAYQSGDLASSKPIAIYSTDGGARWTAGAAPPSTSPDFRNSGAPYAVDCPSTSECVAAGDVFDWCECGTGNPGRYGEVWSTTDTGSRWSDRTLPTQDGFDTWDPEAISCWSASACAVAAYGTPSSRRAKDWGYYPMWFAISRSSGWEPGSASPTAGLQRQWIYGLHCRSASSCVAVGQTFAGQVSAEVGGGGRWSAASF